MQLGLNSNEKVLSHIIFFALDEFYCLLVMRKASMVRSYMQMNMVTNMPISLLVDSMSLESI